MNFRIFNPASIATNLVSELVKLDTAQQVVIFLPTNVFPQLDQLFKELVESEISPERLIFAASFIDLAMPDPYMGLPNLTELLDKGANLQQFPVVDGDWLAAAQNYNSWAAEVFANNFYKVGLLQTNKIFQLAGILPHDLDDASLFYQDWVVGYEMEGVMVAQLITLSFIAIAKLDTVALCVNKDDPLWEIQKGKGRADGMAIADKPALFLKNLPQVDIYWEDYIPKS